MTEDRTGGSGRERQVDPRALAGAIRECMLAEQRGFRRRLSTIERRASRDAASSAALRDLAAAIERSRSSRRRRLAHLPRPTYPENLPVAERRREIASAIRRNQVVVICGETGSGKTTQLPKICLDLGRGVAAMIGHTQPRRIAARSVAARIAQELDSPLGRAVGYQVRFSDRIGPETHIKIMTDGILLAETQGDRSLEHYDTIIIDEAHERSLNIDFLLGYLKQLLPRRPDLKVIITSATIDPQRFSDHFGGAPIVQVSGRTYPVEVRYRPLLSEDPDEEDIRQIDAILAGVDELSREGPGDILVFLSGEREIRETAEALRKRHRAETEILPLYARLSFHEQNRVFMPHAARRIVLATNVAETSLTVPGIRYVIDPGFARISRYSARTRVLRLPVEEISQASANQRTGRCGRLSDGVSIRLYSEKNFLDRAPFTPPEILRTNLASAILRMKALELGDISQFPFVDPPDNRQVRDALQTLHELQALDERNELTAIGRALARLPIDPRVGRMILAAREEGCLDEVIVIAAALSVQDPRDRPLDEEEAAAEAHARFRDDSSDFLGLLKLWSFYQEHAQTLSKSKLRSLCRTSYLSFIRMRDWEDIHGQLWEIVTEMGLAGDRADAAPPAPPPQAHRMRRPDPARYAAIHRALLSGLLGTIGCKTETFEYAGPRGSRFFIFPGSGLFTTKPQWIVAAELVETSKLYARTIARIQPEWVERLGGHLVSRAYAEPHWHQPSARVLAYERVTLYDLPIVEKRAVHYGPIDPKTAREIFIQHALVDGEYDADAPFLRHNREIVEEIQRMEAKRRRRDLLASAQTRFDFYDARIPAGVCTGMAFEKWRHHIERDRPHLLFMERQDLMLQDVRGITEELYPGTLAVEGLDLPLQYLHEPGHPADGVTVTIPIAALAQISEERFEWLVPAFLTEKIAALIKTLPKGLRTGFVPVAVHAEELSRALPFGEGSLVVALAREMSRSRRLAIPPDAFKPASLPPHLQMSFRIVDEDGREVATGRHLAELRQRLGLELESSRERLLQSAFGRTGITTWDFEDLPESVEVKSGGIVIRAFPALVDRVESVELKLLDSPGAAAAETRCGLRRLFLFSSRDQMREIMASLPDMRQMSRDYAPAGTERDFKEDLASAIADRAFLFDDCVRTRGELEARAERGRGVLLDVARQLAPVVSDVLTRYQAVVRQIFTPFRPGWGVAVEDMKSQLGALVYKGFITNTPDRWLKHIPRYLNAIQIRYRKLATSGVASDSQRLDLLAPLWRAYIERLDALGARALSDSELQTYRWMLEEMRVSLFAQELKTSIPISEKRLQAQWARVHLVKG